MVTKFSQNYVYRLTRATLTGISILVVWLIKCHCCPVVQKCYNIFVEKYTHCGVMRCYSSGTCGVICDLKENLFSLVLSVLWSYSSGSGLLYLLACSRLHVTWLISFPCWAKREPQLGLLRYTRVQAMPYFCSLVMQILVTCSSLNARIFTTGNFVRPQIHSLAVSHCISQW